MIRTLPLLLCICCMVPFLAVSTSLADYYKYTDSRGVISMTNKLESVPAKYRASVKVIKEDPPAKAPAQPTEPAAAQPPAPAPQAYSLLAKVAGFPWAKPVAYVCIAIACFWGINRLCRQLRSRHLAKVIYFGFFCGTLLFLYKTYTDHMAETFHKLKEDATTIVNKSKSIQPPKELVQ